METVLIVIHLIIVLAMAVVILLQRSEGGALGIGGGGGGFMTSRGSGNVLTKTTAILAAGFFITSISLTILSNYNNGSSILDRVPGAGTDGDIQPLAPLPITPVVPNTGPQVPIGE